MGVKSFLNISLAVFILFVGASCRTGILFNDAVIGTIQNRREGGCFAQCQGGTECDSRSGECVSNPCSGHCRVERCDDSQLLPVCR